MSDDRGSAGRVRKILAGPAGDGQRLDNFLLRELKGVPRSRVYRLLRRGEVRVNGGRAKPEYRLAAADLVRLPPLREAAPGVETPTRVPDSLQAVVRDALIHEDQRILAFNKPAGLAVHGGSGLSFGLIEALRALRPDEPLELAHRLDRDTSGCLLVARTRAALREVHALLREGQVEKHYTALVAGRWLLGRKKIDAPVLTHARQGGERMVRVHAEGKQAVSIFDPREHYRDLASLMDVEIHTGRTHQIRVHAAFAGHPVAGDEKYGLREFNARMRDFGLRRMFLHSSVIAFRWAGSKQRVVIKVGLPEDLARVLAGLPRKTVAQD
ncbi:MAG: RluA family pseudouridine synthase [Gammaproteobacteria bacterium]|nr:RluA family pseudouridine synthase [Gammaproteobacteria bacterium]